VVVWREWEISGEGDDLGYFGDFIAEGFFDAVLEGDGRAGVADASAVEADGDDAGWGDVDEFEIAAVGLDEGTKEVDDELDAVFEGGGNGRGLGHGISIGGWSGMTKGLY
jgi:hypothetical protein